MRIRLFIGALIFVLIASVTGCDIINPEEPIPTYIKVSQINFDPSPYSSESHNFKDIWVYSGATHIGTFEVPFEIPVIAEEIVQLQLFAGVEVDGVSAVHSAYPYLTIYDTAFYSAPGETIELTPVFNYKSNHQAFVSEDFELPTVTLEASSVSDSVLLQSDDIVLDGNKSGILYATGPGQEMKIQSKKSFHFENRALAPYVELEYMSTIDFSVGVMVDVTSEQAEFGLRATEGEKRKVYFNLANEMGVFTTTADLKLFFEGISTEAGDYIVVDNVRLLADE